MLRAAASGVYVAPACVLAGQRQVNSGMSKPRADEAVSPWRPVFEAVRQAVGQQRDDNGVVGSINWLRQAMEAKGANPNVVRNIIYRNKGRLPDKRALYLILDALWRDQGRPPLQVPELEALLSATASAEQEVLQLLGRDKRRAYQAMVGGLRAGATPKVLVTGRPGSGKTLLTDYVQHGVELADQSKEVVRLEFGSADLSASLSRLATALGVPSEMMESRLVRIGTASAFAVQADAQAEVARLILDAARLGSEPLVLLLHVSQSLASQDALGMAPLRLNTPEVPRVTAPEWLWVTLFEPLARSADVALFVTMTDLPARAMQRLGQFEDPVKLTPPNTAESRRFVKARAPQLSPDQQEDIVKRAGRSFEELRTLTLLAQARAPLEGGAQPDEQYIEQLSRLIDQSGDAELRAFLAALVVLSPPEFPGFNAATLQQVQGTKREPSAFELSFLDAVPGQPDTFRCFSRQLTRELNARLLEGDPEGYRSYQHAAAEVYRVAASDEPGGEAAARYLHHLFEARDWCSMTAWLAEHNVSHAQVRQMWQAAAAELKGSAELDAVARQVAAHYVKLGAYDHPEAVRAFEAGAASDDVALRAWTLVKRAEGEVLAGRFDRAEVLLATAPDIDEPLIRAEAALVEASVKRWRGELSAAADIVSQRVSEQLAQVASSGHDSGESRLAVTKKTVWEGLIAKDRGDLTAAAAAFDAAETDDDLVLARIAFQRGDVALRLGHLDGALTSLDHAVQLAQRSEALPHEQARYLARRGTLQRRRGDLTASHGDFEAARASLRSAELEPVELDFWHAKIDDEAAFTALASGDFEGATFLITHALAGFRAYAASRDTDAGFRVMRATLHLAVAYACRGLALPLRRPMPTLRDGADGPDLRHARRRIEEVTAELSSGARYQGGLTRQALLLGSQFATTGDEAMRLAEEALEQCHYPYQQAEGLAARAAAQLRRGGGAGGLAKALDDLEAASAALAASLLGARLPDERGDTGLRAQLLALRLAAHLATHDDKAAAAALSTALDDDALAPYHEGLLRAFGESADSAGVGDAWKSHRRLRAQLGVDGTGPSTPARLPDALVAAWRSRARPRSAD